MSANRTEPSPDGTADLLYGMQAIADFLSIKRSVAYHLAATHRIPTFKIGRTVCARRSTILAALDALDPSATHHEHESGA